MKFTPERRAIFGLTAPAYFWLAVTILLPLAAMLYVSFLDKSPLVPRPSEFTLKHYESIFTRPVYRQLAWWSLTLGFWVTLFSFLLGYPAAYALARHVRGRWREALFLLVILPFWSNALVRTFSWTMVLRNDGLIDGAVQFLIPGAGPIDLLYSYPAVVIGLVHSYLPYMILTCYISLQAVDESLLEAARSLGAGTLTVLRRILLPITLPGIIAGAVLIYVPVVGSFMEPRILGGPKGATLGMAIEEQFMVTANWPLGSALSFAMLAIVGLIGLACYPVTRRRLRRD